MNRAIEQEEAGHAGWRPAGRFLDKVPQAMYAAAHVMFLAVGIWFWARAEGASLPYAGAFGLYLVTQVGFLAFFGWLITMKTAVLVEQSLLLVMLLLIVLKAT